jgi:tetrahydromethanopterin S-methyltransferase subunit C
MSCRDARDREMREFEDMGTYAAPIGMVSRGRGVYLGMVFPRHGVSLSEGAGGSQICGDDRSRRVAPWALGSAAGS